MSWPTLSEDPSRGLRVSTGPCVTTVVAAAMAEVFDEGLR